MSYIENIYVCLGAPLFIAAICMRGHGRRMMLFLLGGMTACLLSSYISTFFAALQGLDLQSASLFVTPITEELMKFLPVLFYLIVFEPGKRDIADCIIMDAVGFATFENACYLTNNGAAHIMHLLIRGFGTGAMHVVCGFLIAIGLLYLWDRTWLRIAGTAGLLSIAMTYHSIYNLLVSQEGVAPLIGYIIPILTVIIYLIFGKDPYYYKKPQDLK